MFEIYVVPIILLLISMLITSCLFVMYYFCNDNYVALRTNLKRAYTKFLYTKTNDMLGVLHEAAKNISNTIENEDLRDEFNSSLGDIAFEKDGLPGVEELIENGWHIASKYLQLFTKSNILLCVECHEEVILDYFLIIFHLFKKIDDCDVMISVLVGENSPLIQSEGECQKVIGKIIV